ncbi:MAG: hypothetical protein HGB21_05605 [Nitrospirae bacterium]|nr:hypothetical protein [Nitrospirota bacterium]
MPQQSTGERMRSAWWRQRNAHPRFTVRPIAIEAQRSGSMSFIRSSAAHGFIPVLPTPATVTASLCLAIPGVPMAAWP